MKFLKFSIVSSLFSLPVFVGAQTLMRTNNILTQIRIIISGILIPLAFSLALLYFFWGVAKYIRSEGEGKDDGKRIMIWGVVALFVISSVWGLVYFLADEFNLQVGGTVPMPRIQYTP